MIFKFLLCIGLSFSLSLHVEGSFEEDGYEVSEEEFNNNYQELKQRLISDIKPATNSNEIPSFYYKYTCGAIPVMTKMDTGATLTVQFVTCSMPVENAQCKGIQRSCTASFVPQDLLLSGTPIVSLVYNADKCTEVSETDECSLMKNRPKRDLSNKQFQHPMTMEKPYGYDEDIKAMFDHFIELYNKDYSLDSATETYHKRYKIFEKNLKIVKQLNRIDQGTAVYGITEFMDYSEEEYKKYLAPGLHKSLTDIRQVDLKELDTANIPDSVDWREKGAVTKVKNQGQCGSCWAFSTTGNIEGQWFIKKKKLLSLSEQELVDCDSLDEGCGGGLPSNAYKSIEKLGGLETESDYPYEGVGEKCNLKRSDLRVFINDSIALPKDEGKLAAWLAANGPISIGINANMMQFYFGGISHPWRIFCNPSSLDHGVLIVGYGTENGTPYWIIKNSWGPNWGEKGYYRIYRGDGSCGVNQMATSAIVD